MDELNLSLIPNFIPTLYDINRSFEVIEVGNYKGIKGEEQGRMTTFTNFVLARKPVLLFGNRASGKCLSEDCEVVDSYTGEYLTIKEVIKRKKLFTKTLKQNNKLEDVFVKEFYDNGLKECFKIITKLGREIEITSNHPLLEKDNGWLSLDQGLNNGMKIAIPNKIECFGNLSDINDAKLIGYLISDGCTRSRVFRFSNIDNMILKDFSDSLKDKYSCKLSKISIKNACDHTIQSIIPKQNKPFLIRKYFDNLGLTNKYSYEKFIPPHCFTYNKESMKEFIKSLFSCDGSINYSKNGESIRWNVSYCSSSKRLIYQLSHLLLRFGIFGRIRKRRTKCKDSYILDFRKDYAKKYCEEIGFTGNKDKLAKQFLKNFTYTKKYLCEEKKLDIEEDIIWDKIISITPVGFKQTYDLTINDTHNFISNDIIVHNSCLMRLISYYCPIPVEIGNASDKADIRDESINEGTHMIIIEINKVSKFFGELLKDFGEGISSKYKVIDEYKKIQHFELKPLPFLTSLAVENQTILGDELISRLTVINMDSSIKQNISVVEDKLERAQNPFKKRDVTPEYVQKCQSYVHSLPPIDNYTFIYLPGKSVISTLPMRFTDVRRDIEKYLTNTYGITLFHYHDRTKVSVKKGKNALLVTPADTWYNHRIYGDNIIQSALKCSPEEVMIIDILRKYKELHPTMPDMDHKNIYGTILKNGINPTAHTVQKMLNNLSKNGIIIENSEKKPKTYESSNLFKDHKVEIDWKQVVECCKVAVKENFPSVAEDYIKRFCTPPILVIDPFTGRKLDILSEKLEDIGIKVDRKVGALEMFTNDQEDGQIAIEEEVIGFEEEAVEDKLNKLKETFKDFYDTNSDAEGKISADLIEEKFNDEEVELLLSSNEMVDSPVGFYTILE